MPDWRNILVAMTITVILMMTLTGCGGTPEPTSTPTPTPTSEPTPEPSSTAQELSGKIAGINPAEQAAFPELLGALQGLDKAQGEGAITEEEGKELEDDLSGKFSDFIKNRIDEINPAEQDALADFFKLQAVQELSEYERLIDPETHDYKEEQMGKKFNEWVRNRVDEIDPTDPNSLKYFFWLQDIQGLDKYDEFVTQETHDYKEEQMEEKFNEWVRNRVDEIDPTDPNSLSEFFNLQRIQWTDKYDEFATPETHEYKEEQMKQKFNEFIENRVNELDPNDPNFLEELEKLRVLQLSDKYDRLCTKLMHDWKVKEVKKKFGQYVTNLVDNLNPLLPNFMEDLGKLTGLQNSDIYQELCPEAVKEYKEEQLIIKLAKAPGEIPSVIGTLPLDEQTDVLVSQPILIAFDQPMIPPSVEVAIEVSPSIDYTIIWLEESIIARLQPLVPLKYDTTYTVSISAEAMSIYGMPLEEEVSFSFATREPGETPHIVATSPFDGQADASGSQPLEIRFDQPMSSAPTEAAIEISPPIDYAVIWYEDNTLAVMQPLAPLDNDTVFTVNIGAEALSAGGMPLAADYSFSFFTGMHETPRVLGTLPLDGQADIPSNHPIQIIFDQPMDTASIEAALKVSPAMDYTTTWLEANFVLMLEPVTTLAVDTGYTISIGDEAISTFGMPLAKDYSFSFTTGK